MWFCAAWYMQNVNAWDWGWQEENIQPAPWLSSPHIRGEHFSGGVPASPPDRSSSSHFRGWPPWTLNDLCHCKDVKSLPRAKPDKKKQIQRKLDRSESISVIVCTEIKLAVSDPPHTFYIQAIPTAALSLLNRPCDIEAVYIYPRVNWHTVALAASTRPKCCLPPLWLRWAKWGAIVCKAVSGDRCKIFTASAGFHSEHGWGWWAAWWR